MFSLKKSKSHFLAAIGTVLIHLLLLAALSIDFTGEQSSKLSDADLDNMELQMEDMTPEDIQMTPPGKDASATQNDKASESISKDQGVVKSQPTETERTATDQEAVALATPDTIIPPKPEVVELIKADSVKQAKKDSVILAQITKLQKVSNQSDAYNQRYQHEREKYQYYVKNYKNIRNFRKVYPYAMKTKQLIENLNKQLSTMKNESEKAKLIKETEKKLFADYENAVRTMTVSQGKLLLKLIARETNKTGYELIKDYKGSIPASFWYGVGKIFGTDLKTEFHKEQEDSVIENILDKYNKNDLY